jgi:hypothetical protein
MCKPESCIVLLLSPVSFTLSSTAQDWGELLIKEGYIIEVLKKRKLFMFCI